MLILVTGAAGFIGHRAALALLDAGCSVVGVDNLNTYYDVELKRRRLSELTARPGFRFHEIDIADHSALSSLPDRDSIDRVAHLAAQAGVRRSLEDPFSYASSNLLGHLSVLEFCRTAAKRPLLIYASSSAVYGEGAPPPFRETDPLGDQLSLYGASKRADELMSLSYASLYDLPQVALRLFTVYGPMGRPDMAYWIFTKKILGGEAISLFNSGRMRRDFTYIEDAIAGLTAVLLGEPRFKPGAPPHRIYNLGSGEAVDLMAFVHHIESAADRAAEIVFQPRQPGDMLSTHADIGAIARDYGYAPSVGLGEGVRRFVDWFAASPFAADIAVVGG